MQLQEQLLGGCSAFVSPLVDFALLHFSRSCAVDPDLWSHAHLLTVDVGSHVGNV